MSKPLPRSVSAVRRDHADITAASLRRWPIPSPNGEGDKNTRGLVVCVGGSPTLPGTMVLVGTAALRAGAGVVRIGLPASITTQVGVAVPEALVFGLPTTRSGSLSPRAVDTIARYAQDAHAVLLGPGAIASRGLTRVVSDLLPRLSSARALILDAAALDGAVGAVEAVRGCAGRIIMTPHTGEMARLLKVDRQTVEADPLAAARRAADHFQAVVALKGPRTWIVAPDGETHAYAEGSIGLATSGSGDALTGLIAGLAGRGADPLQATAWGVYVHGTAGNRLRERTGQIGFLARELADQAPAIMTELTSDSRSAPRPARRASAGVR